MTKEIAIADSPLTQRQIDAAALLAKGEASISEIARTIGVSRHTVYDWRLKPAFQEELERLSEEYHQRVLSMLRAAGTRAAKRLIDGMRSRTSQGVKCAETILKFAFGDPSKADLSLNLAAVNSAKDFPNLTNLPPVFRAELLGRLGGPPPDDDSNTETHKAYHAGLAKFSENKAG